MMAQRRLAIGVKRGQVDDLRWVDVDGSAASPDRQPRRDPLRASRGILIAVPLAILLWLLALGAIGVAVLA